MALLGKLKDKADVGGMLSGAKEKAQDALKNTLGELKALGDVLAQCGFIVGDVAIVVGLPPKFTITLEQREAGSADLGKLSEQMETMTKVQRNVVKSLQQIYDMNDMLESEGYTVGQVEVELGVIPEVTVHLISTASRAFHTEGEEG